MNGSAEKVPLGELNLTLDLRGTANVPTDLRLKAQSVNTHDDHTTGVRGQRGEEIKVLTNALRTVHGVSCVCVCVY